jgi:hypothetical protein
MSNYQAASPMLGAPAPMSATYTFATSIGVNPAWPLGYEMRALDPTLGGAVFVHVVGNSASAPQSLGQLVLIQGNSVLLAGTGNQGSNFPIGLAAGAISASNVAGWVQIEGYADYARMSNHSVGVGASAFVASTLGNVATTQGAAGAQVKGIAFPVSLSSSASAAVTMYLNRPFVVGVSANL